jgi:hypothetical protein
MAASANLRKIMKETPRALEVVTHDDKDLVPMGRKKISRARSTQRQADYLNKVMRGDILLDEQAADVVRQYLDAHHARQ